MWEQGVADAGVPVQPGEAGQEQQQGLLQGGQAGRPPTQQEAQEGQKKSKKTPTIGFLSR